jgi:esterase/lipase/1-acyl-sn-glycerol-3-phosphate acyltransferase
MASRVFRATAAMIGVLRKVLRFSLHVEGLDNITDRPTLFVVNHFTRMETFIVPYVLHKHADKELRALADAGLFKGLFGGYLRRMGARSTREPLRNRMIIGDLVTGRHDWVIFPEGVMVKSKKVVHRGKLHISHPELGGRPHTGAAVLALKAELVRERYLTAWHDGDAEVMKMLEERYGLMQEQCLNHPGLVVTPVNITFYPLRPDDNVISRMATGLKPGISDHILEELKTEGSLLLKHTDMTIYFNPPVEVKDYLARPLSALRKVPFLGEEQRESMVLSTQRWPLTRNFMKTIYTSTAINLDHLFCIGLRELKNDYISEGDFHRALYLAALTLREHDERRVHDSLHNDLVRLITDESHAPLENIYTLANAEGIVKRADGYYRVLPRNRKQALVHEDVRLHDTTRVIANEVEPMSFVVKTIGRYVNMSTDKLRSEIVRRVSALDVDHFETDYTLYYEQGLSKAPSIGRPFFLKSPSSNTGILLCHGYLAAPEEMRPLGEFLHDAGYTVYGARLQGFGTTPEQLLDVSWEDWMVSFNRAYAVLKNCCDKVILGGFSAGALLVLLNAARKKEIIDSIFCIDTPLVLMDRHACALTPAALGWNRLMGMMHIPAKVSESIENISETPDINYPVHYLEGVRELCKLISACRESLPDVEAPCLIVHGSQDPVADPKSAEILYKEIGSAVKKQVTVEADYHNLVQKKGREKVFAEVLKFIEGNPASIENLEEVA